MADAALGAPDMAKQKTAGNPVAAGLIAGACSMAMGEWISVQSSRELYQRELAVERADHREDQQARPQLQHRRRELADRLLLALDHALVGVHERLGERADRIVLGQTIDHLFRRHDDMP